MVADDEKLLTSKQAVTPAMPGLAQPLFVALRLRYKSEQFRHRGIRAAHILGFHFPTFGADPLAPRRVDLDALLPADAALMAVVY